MPAGTPRRPTTPAGIFKKHNNMKHTSILAIAAALLVGGGFTTAFAAEHKHHGPSKGYPLKTCVVSGDEFDHDAPVKVTHKGTDVYLCCKSCVKKFNADPAKYVKMVKDAAHKKK